jgi:recombinational DNA repair protein RecT
MALKTVVRRMRPWLPMSPVFARALSADERAVTVDEQAGQIVWPEEPEALEGSVD